MNEQNGVPEKRKLAFADSKHLYDWPMAPELDFLRQSLSASKPDIPEPAFPVSDIDALRRSILAYKPDTPEPALPVPEPDFLRQSLSTPTPDIPEAAFPVSLFGIVGQSLITLSHYSKHPISTLCRHAITSDNAHKPGGLWLSDDSDYGWRRFVKDAQSKSDEWSDADEISRYKTMFSIASEELHNILILKTRDAIYQFAFQYGEPLQRNCGDGYGVHIEWSRVRSLYKGILITPYQPALSHRNGIPELHWYRWDCASGCFWDTSCLTQIGPSQLTRH